MKNYLLLLEVASSVSLSSCGNDDDEVVKSKTELLTSSGWKTTALTINPGFDFDGDGVKETDLMAGQDACNTDDITVYKTDKTYTEEEGATKCDPTDQQVYGTGTWTFNSDETVLSTTASGSGNTPTNYTITELSESTMKFTTTFTDSATTYTVNGTLTH